MPTYIIQTTINPGVSYEVDQAEYEQLRDLGLLLNNNPNPLAGVFDTEVSALVQNVNSQTYLRLTQLPLQPHTHLTTEIADSGSTGRALLKTTSALDARTAIGALASTAVGAANGVAQLDANSRVPVSQLPAGLASGVASLDSGGKIPQSQLPAIALQEFLGAVASQTAMLALTGQRGDWTTRTDLGTDWQLIAEPSTTLANWRERTYPASPVQSVDGKVGAVTLGTTAATANELARRGAGGTLLVATATQPSEATTLAQTQQLDAAAVAPVSTRVSNLEGAYFVETIRHSADVGAQSIANTVGAAAAMSRALRANTAMWSVANPTRFVAPVAGYYDLFFNFHINSGGAAGGRLEVKTRINGLASSAEMLSAGPRPTTDFFSINGFGSVPLAAGDYVELFIGNNTGGAVDIGAFTGERGISWIKFRYAGVL